MEKINKSNVFIKLIIKWMTKWIDNINKCIYNNYLNKFPNIN